MITYYVKVLRQRIEKIAKRMNRAPSDVCIVAVTKTRSAQEIREVLRAGILDIGESRVQEASRKIEELKAAGEIPAQTRFHMIGHLQTNKVKEAVRLFDLIQSVDSIRLAKAIDKEAANIGKVQDVLIEVKTSAEATKYGVLPEDMPRVITEIVSLKNVSIKGLMTIAPLVDDPQEARPCFRKLRELREHLRDTGYGIPDTLSVLSMGMSDDFEAAIEEGATMVRLGRVIFQH
ncbi:MAG: YggS family pyridoxal phosphate-dependent enzyme [Candidatus Omnitrophica bacterium]|nr:YggS family pyridoxal phosphate-dependent enzyme [Candidatus Omnitrophota bacterium]